ncbi:hypothetical protein [Piscirickettsia litoralis]|uniref:Uncharacterized protein n=1 Tax=Piscirickettsia litoralis TaxID=1891921 RepID=A0ABX3A2Z9_9GAMM|nr:hypothetical protein [Piscirickettsia litoralis]ODN42006.1 hypothetical protein BGC07_02330 [Piscirickettsia litoralis]
MQLAERLQTQVDSEEDSRYAKRLKESLTPDVLEKLSEGEKKAYAAAIEVMNNFAPHIKELSKY